MSMLKEIHVPDIGDFKNVDVIEVQVHIGDAVKAEDPVITLESDKASMDVPSPEAGVVKEIKIKVGDKVSEGDLILLLEVEDGAAAATKPKAEAPAAPVAAKPATPPPIAPPPADKPADKPQAPPKAAPPAAGGGIREVRVPDIGDFKDVDIIDVVIAPGDTLNLDQPMIVLESDKASMEVPSPAEGVVKEVKVKVGDKVSEGDLILLLDTGAVGAPAEEVLPPEMPTAPMTQPPPAVPIAPTTPKPATFEPRPPVTQPPPAIEEVGFAKAHASPSVRQFARELGVDLGKIKEGSGRKGRITKEDVQAFVKKVMAGEVAVEAAAPAAAPPTGAGIPPIPAVDFAKFGEIETKPLTKIKRLTGINLSRNWLNVPHVTHHDEADITETEEFRKSLAEEAKKRDVRVTMLSFLLKASAAALKQFPTFNSSLDPSGENLILKKYVHIGVAVDTPEGLVVPVVRDVDTKNIFDLSVELGAISTKARARKLSPGDMQGACFTISSLGGIGGVAFTPIVNAPEVCILGVTRSQMKPVWNGKEFVPRLMLPLSLSYDHRVVDGAEAARFVRFLVEAITDIRRLLL